MKKEKIVYDSIQHVCAIYPYFVYFCIPGKRARRTLKNIIVCIIVIFNSVYAVTIN